MHLELGGKAPVIVFDDADLSAAAEGIAGAALFNAGQDCTAATRVLAAPGIHDDLVAALAAGHLAGAALDVQQHEPLPPEDPLWAAPGVFITPHIAGQSLPQVVAAQFVAGLQALARGEPPPNPVDRVRGY